VSKKFKLIYVVDDDDIYVFTALRVLESIDITDRVQVFDNGKKAFDQLLTDSKLGNDLPELVLLDLNMPIWDGWFFLSEFEKTNLMDKIKIMVVSSSIETEDMDRVTENKSVKEFISKPLNKESMKQLFDKQ